MNDGLNDIEGYLEIKTRREKKQNCRLISKYSNLYTVIK